MRCGALVDAPQGPFGPTRRQVDGHLSAWSLGGVGADSSRLWVVCVCLCELWGVVVGGRVSPESALTFGRVIGGLVWKLNLWVGG